MKLDGLGEPTMCSGQAMIDGHVGRLVAAARYTDVPSEAERGLIVLLRRGKYGPFS